jgi:demethylmenaquinone methyltransferase/2-methoxy-6-polyprenyl-1,4-benzoquinol methylase
MMSLNSIRKTFTDWAPRYDATHAWSMPYRKTARLALGIQPGDRVLDLACGTGLNFAHLRQLVGETGSVLGVDLTPAMLAVARQRIARGGWSNVTVREADAAHLPLTEASFNRVICSYALTIIPDYIRAIEETKRVLIPGGRLVSLEVQIPGQWSARWLHALGQICSVDIRHRVLETLRLAFPQLQVRTCWFGLVFLAIGTKV